MGFVRPTATAVGLLAGLAAVAAWTPHLKMASGEGTLGLDVRMTAEVPGELALAGDNLMINARRLLPGTHHRDQQGTATVVNQTGSPLVVRVTALPSSLDGSDKVMVSLTSGRHRIARGTLEQLKRHGGTFHLPLRGRRRVKARVWIPKSVDNGYAGVLEDVSLELTAVADPRAAKPGAAT
jgi:hypothetical protein